MGEGAGGGMEEGWQMGGGAEGLNRGSRADEVAEEAREGGSRGCSECMGMTLMAATLPCQLPAPGAGLWSHKGRGVGAGNGPSCWCQCLLLGCVPA